MRPNLQSGGFNHSPKDPHKTADASHDNNWNVTSDAARPIYPNGIWRNKPTPPNILFAKGHYRFALLVGRVGIEPTHHFWYRILSPVRLPVPPSAHLCSRVFLLPRDSLCNGHSRSYLYSMREEFNGAQRRIWTFKHWFLRPAALPVCILVHIRSGATIALNVTNPARQRVCTNWIICLWLAAN